MDDDRSPLAGTEVHRLRSRAVGDEFKIFVGHCGTDAGTPAPVLYLTDANGFFGAAVDAVRLLQLARHLPPLYIVGIGYRMGGLADTVAVRSRDLTPSRDDTFAAAYPGHGMGGALPFLEFIREELMPWVRNRYPVEPHDATYFGHSLGGLFGSVVLFRAPDTFRRYVLSSPSCWWDGGVVYTMEAAYAAAHDDLTATVFLGVGALEDPAGRAREAANMPADEQALAARYPVDMVALMQKLADRLTGRRYPHLRMASQVFADEFHVTVAPLVLSRGLRHVFDAPR